MDLPIENGGSFHGFLYVYRRVGVFCPGRSGVPSSSRGLSHLPQGDLSHLPVDDGDFFGRRTGSHDMPWHAMTCHEVLVGECDRMTFSRSIDVYWCLFSIHKICSIFDIDIRDFPYIFSIWSFNIWTIPDKWRSIAAKIIYFYGPSIPWRTVKSPEGKSISFFGLRVLLGHLGFNML